MRQPCSLTHATAADAHPSIRLPSFLLPYFFFPDHSHQPVHVNHYHSTSLRRDGHLILPLQPDSTATLSPLPHSLSPDSQQPMSIPPPGLGGGVSRTGPPPGFGGGAAHSPVSDASATTMASSAGVAGSVGGGAVRRDGQGGTAVIVRAQIVFLLTTFTEDSFEKASTEIRTVSVQFAFWVIERVNKGHRWLIYQL